MQPSRKIASNALLRGDGTLLRQPLIGLDTEGRVVSVAHCAEPDREPFTEFYAGVLVVGLSRAAFEAVRDNHTTPLTTLLPPHLAENGRPALLSGLDYATMCFTAASRYEAL